MVGYVTCFLFSVLVLGHLSDHKGRTWRREMTQMYCIEMTIPLRVKKGVKAMNQLIRLFPSAHCHPPTEDKAFSNISGEYFCPYIIDILLLIYINVTR